jgi:uncharacterized membrane protein
MPKNAANHIVRAGMSPCASFLDIKHLIAKEFCYGDNKNGIKAGSCGSGPGLAALGRGWISGS